MKKLLLISLLLILTSSMPPVEAHSSGTCYESVLSDYTINADRTLSVHTEYTIYEPARVTGYSIKHHIPTPNTENISVSSDTGVLRWESKKTQDQTLIEIKISFGLGFHGRMKYWVSYVARDLVSGVGPAYKGIFGGISLHPKALPYRNYIIRVRGPAGSEPFLVDPEAERVGVDPPVIQYQTSVDAPGSFDGLRVQFYTQPVYYKLTLVKRLINRNTVPTKNVELDVILFPSHTGRQFSALASANIGIKTMYVDEENNWHGVFEIGEIPPSGTRELRLELIYDVGIHSPEIHENLVGELGLVPADLSPYLRPERYWESDNPSIRQEASAILGEGNAFLVAKRIQRFVVDHLTYRSQPTRQGALWAYVEGVGDCSEYTDLSVALARAAGLPARAVYGWCYTEENQLGHAWVEFYLPGVGWQPADPTWCETVGDYLCRLDPVHIARVVRGLGSSESGVVWFYMGSPPDLEENASLSVLKISDAASGFVDAARHAIQVAERLLRENPNEALSQSLMQALGSLDRALEAGDESQRIAYAKWSIEKANEVIRVLGRPPSREVFAPWRLVLILLAAGTAIWVGLAAIHRLSYR